MGVALQQFCRAARDHADFIGTPGAFAGYKALAACLALKRSAESHTRADADKMSAIPAQPADRPENYRTRKNFPPHRLFHALN